MIEWLAVALLPYKQLAEVLHDPHDRGVKPTRRHRCILDKPYKRPLLAALVTAYSSKLFLVGLANLDLHFPNPALLVCVEP